MSLSDAFLNLGILFVVMTPLIFLSCWVIHKTPLQGLSGIEKWQAYRIRIGAVSIILVSIGLMLYFILNVIELWQMAFPLPHF